LTTSLADGFVKLRDSDESLSSVPPLSVPSLLRRAKEQSPEVLALAVKREGQWVKWNYDQYYKVK